MIGQTVSHYKILQKLGEGGMGVVYKAHDTALDRDVALKFLPSEMVHDQAARRRFMNEARAASALDHPNIAVVHEFGESSDGHAYICMAYYDGESLRSMIDRGQLEIRTVLEIAIQVADGLHRAHGAGITHRDIKPANIILTTDNVVKILDFGLAKLGGEAKSVSSGHRGGTAPYMSPEQVLGSPVDHRSDLFSFGVLLYEMVAGKRPFEGEHEAALFYTLLNTEPIPLSVRRIGIPPGLERIVDRLLRKDPQQRYQNASDARADLMKVREELGRATETPERPNLAERIFRGRRPGRPAVLAGSLLLAAAVFFWIWSTLSRPPLTMKPSEYVVVADFYNETGNPVFDHAITEAIRVSLRQSSYINLLPADRIEDALKRMRAGEQQRLDEPTALSLAKREGARVVVAGTISPVGNGYVLISKIIDAARGEIISLPRREIARIEDVLAGLDKLCEDIREALGEPLQDITKSSLPLRRVTTPSLEALELYSLGERMELQGRYKEAAEYKERAAGIDSLFTMAISDLSYIHRKLGNDSLAVSYHARVLPLIDRVTDRERFYILTTYYGPSFEFDFQKTYDAARQMVERFPNDAEAHGQFGYLGMYFCDLGTSREENMKALALDSSYAATLYNNSGYAAALGGNVDDALSNFLMSKRIRPEYTATDAYIAHTLWVGGDLDSAGSHLRAILGRGDLRRRVLTHAQLGLLFYARGRPAGVKAECDSAIVLARQASPPLPEAWFHYLAGEMSAATGDVAAFRRAMSLAEKHARAPFTELALIGASYARNGMKNPALAVMERIAGMKSADPFFLRRRADFIGLVKGSILLRDGDHRAAKQEFDAIGKLHCGDPLHFTARLGAAECEASRSDSTAMREYLELLQVPGELVMGPILSYPSTGSWTGWMIPEIHLRLAELYAKRDDRGKALRHLDAAFRYWSDAETPVRRIREARILKAKLTNNILPPHIK